MKYLFWTGGVDSTYRLLKLMEAGHSIQPIYIDKKIDIRKNKRHEIKTMSNLTPIIRKAYPQGVLLDVRVVSHIKPVNDVREKALLIGCGPSYKKRIGSQYVAFCEYASTHPQPIELGVEIGGRAEKFLRGKTEIKNGNRVISELAIKKEPEIAMFKNIEFPLLHMTKEDIRLDAEKSNMIGILNQTFTCWYPRSSTYPIPCRKCEMCKARIRMGV